MQFPRGKKRKNYLPLPTVELSLRTIKPFSEQTETAEYILNTIQYCPIYLRFVFCIVEILTEVKSELLPDCVKIAYA